MTLQEGTDNEGKLSGTYNIISNFDLNYGDIKTKLIFAQFDITFDSENKTIQAIDLRFT